MFHQGYQERQREAGLQKRIPTTKTKTSEGSVIPRISRKDIPIPITVVSPKGSKELVTHGAGVGRGDVLTDSSGRALIEKPLGTGRSRALAAPVSAPASTPAPASFAEAVTNRNKAMLEYMYQDKPEAPKPYVDYTTQSSSDLTKKLNFLKDPNVDLSKLDNKLDGEYGALYRWEQIKANIARGSYTSEQKQQIASNFFDQTLAPVNATEIEKDKWMQFAYNFHFDMEDMYRKINTKSTGTIKGLWDDLHGAINVGKSVGDLFGVGVTATNPQMVQEWLEKRHGGFWDQVEQLSEVNMPAIKRFNYSLNKDAEFAEFQGSMLPFGGVRGALAYGAVTLAPWVLFDVIAPGSGAGEAGVVSRNVEAALKARKLGKAGELVERAVGAARAGRIASGTLNGARDGYIYGVLTRDQKDKNKAYQDAIQWAALNAFFGVTGGTFANWLDKRKGVASPISTEWTPRPRKGMQLPPPPPAGYVPLGGPPGRRPPLPLMGDRGVPLRPPEPEAPSAPTPEAEPLAPPPDPQTAGMLDRMKQQLGEIATNLKTKLNLGEKGRREATPEEVEEESEAAVSEEIAKHGQDGERVLDNGAAQYLLDLESKGLTAEHVKERERQILETGTPEQRVMLDSITRLRSALGDMKLSELSTEGKQNLLARLQALSENATTRLTKNVAVLQEALRQRFMAIPPDKLDRHVVSYLLQQVAPTLPQGATQEQVLGAIKTKWADLVVQAGKDAEDALAADPLGEAIKANSAKKRVVDLEEGVAKGMAATTRRWTNKAGESGVSYSFSPSWTVYAKEELSRNGKQWNSQEIKNWLKDLDEEDFATDIQAFFIPQFAPDKRLHLEVGKVAGGYDFTNLYAFAYNYIDSMPKEYAERLEEELFNSPKMQRFFEGMRSPQQKQKAIRQMALAMWNHVDDFLASGHFPKELNVFRSTQSDLRNPTKWQNELFAEREQAEAAVIDRMFKKGTGSNQAAKDALSVLFRERRKAYASGDQTARQKISVSLTEQLVKGAKETKTRYKDWGMRHAGVGDLGESKTPIASIPRKPWMQLIENKGDFGRLINTPQGAELHLSDKAFQMVSNLHLHRTHPDFNPMHRTEATGMSLNPGRTGIGNFIIRLDNDPVRGSFEDRMKLKDLLQKAQQVKPGFSVSALKTDIAESEYQPVRLEEHSHGWQRWLVQRKDPYGDIENHLSDKGYVKLRAALQTKVPSLLPYVQRDYGKTSGKIQLVEAGVKLLTMNPNRYGASEDQAYDGIVAYLDLIEEEHGDDVFNELAVILGVPVEEMRKMRGK